MLRTANNDRKKKRKDQLRFIKVMNEMDKLHVMFGMSAMKMLYNLLGPYSAVRFLFHVMSKIPIEINYPCML